MAMSASRRWLTGRVWGFVLLGCAAGAGFAWYSGAVSSSLWSAGTATDVADADESTPAEKPEWELPPELLEAQSEPEAEDEAMEGVSIDEEIGATPIRPRQRSAAGVSPFDEPTEEESAGGVEPANFEESADEPPAAKSRTSKDGSAKPSGKSKPTGDRHPAPIDDDAGASRGGPLMDLDRIEALESAGEYIAAQQELSRWFWQRPEMRERILPRLDRMSRALYFVPQPHYYEPYVVQPGDQLRVIGQKHKLSWEYLAKLNHTEPRRIRAGQKLKVVPGPFAALVSLSRYELVIHLGGSFVKNYRVGIGKDGSTPIGAFTVKNKMVDPTYYGPEGVIAHDDPQNPLGERWIDIGDGYGVHGTIEPQSIGRSESRGCIRMLNPDVEEVYDFLVVGSEVRIER